MITRRRHNLPWQTVVGSLFIETVKDLHLKLYGDFGLDAAQELLALLKGRGRRSSRVFIHTGNLKGIDPSGKALFKDKCRVFHGESASLIFTGENAVHLAPEESMVG